MPLWLLTGLTVAAWLALLWLGASYGPPPTLYP